jgi:pantothenate kinase
MATIRSIDELAASLPEGDRVIVGIAGAPGAGKSTIAAELVAHLGPTAVLLPMDGFHLPQAQLRRLGRRERMGAPDTFDVDGLLATLRALRASGSSFRNDGDSVTAPGFNREIEEPVPDAITISPSFRKVIVEGNYLLLERGGWEAVAPLLDATYFVQLEDGIRLERLIERHVRFGKSPADARAWATGPDEANARIIAATARHADHVIALP